MSESTPVINTELTLDILIPTFNYPTSFHGQKLANHLINWREEYEKILEETPIDFYKKQYIFFF